MSNVTGERASGVLLHVSSLPGGAGIGDLGPAAHAWIDWLRAAGQRYWQVLPCGPPGYGDSPYQATSTYAGNPLLISLDWLVERGLLDNAEVEQAGADHVDFAAVSTFKMPLIEQACSSFERRADADLQTGLATFRTQPGSHWLADYALFAALKQAHKLRAWTEWPAPLANRQPAALDVFRQTHADQIRNVEIGQFLFWTQWQELRAHARRQNIRLIGDCPIYVAHDSAEVWSDPQLFELSSDGSPRVVAGVPPDYFSATGQRWGNPLYRWELMAADDHTWWRRRLAHSVQCHDLTRIDHFRGFDAYWEIPAEAPDAVQGRWCPGPGDAFFESMRTAFGSDLPFIAEDLGMLTESVHALRARQRLPGMRVLQFGFDGHADNPHHPHNIPADVLYYTATHDNDTTAGWYAGLSDDERTRVDQFAGADQVVNALIRAALQSPAYIVIVPMQDVLGLPASARLNTPGTLGHNWSWRLLPDQHDASTAAQLAELGAAAGRNP